ncbi:MAG: hypothetical protein GY754_28840 [bacterium]|nr:hypothetical protein [bacterium]
MNKWAQYSPANFRHKDLLLQAGLSQLKGKINESKPLYDKAISLAQENGFMQDQAIANELAAKLYYSNGPAIRGEKYAREAVYCYERWGVLLKAGELREKYLEQ